MTGPGPMRGTRHPFDWRVRAAAWGPLLLLLATVFVVGGIAPEVEVRGAAAAAYQAAADDCRAGQQTYAESVASLDTARDAMNEVAGIVGELTSLSGEPVPAAAAVALDDARETAAAAVSPLADPAPEPCPSGDTDGRGDVAELREATARTGVDATAWAELGAAAKARADAAPAAAAALGKALGDYLTAVVARGAELVRQHPHAAPSELDAFRSVLDSLPDADTADLPDRLRAAIKAAAALG